MVSAVTAGKIADPVQLSLPLLPALPKPAGQAPEKIYDRIVAPLRTRGSDMLAAFKKYAPRWLAGGAGAAVVAGALLGGDPDGGTLALSLGAILAVGGTAIFTVGDGLLPNMPRDADREAAKRDATKALAEAITEAKGQPWSKLIKSAIAHTDGASNYLRLDFDPAQLSKLTAGERTALMPSIIASLPESVRMIAPYVSIDTVGSNDAAGLHKPGPIWRTIGTLFCGGAGLVVGGVAGVFGGALGGFVLGGVGALGALLLGGVAALFGSTAAYDALCSASAWLFHGGTVAGVLLGPPLGALGTAAHAVNETLKDLDERTTEFHAKACALLLPLLDANRSLLSAHWPARVGTISIGADEHGRAIINVSTTGEAPTEAGDSAALKDAFADTLPKEMRRLLDNVELRFGANTGP